MIGVKVGADLSAVFCFRRVDLFYQFVLAVLVLTTLPVAACSPSASRRAFRVALAHRVNLAVGGADRTCTGRARFEGAEHRCLGNFGDTLLTVDTGNTTNLVTRRVPIDSVVFRNAQGVAVGTFGDIVAMGGDYFAPDSLLTVICDGATDAERRGRLNLALATLDNAPQEGVRLILEEFDEELAEIRKNDTNITWQVYKRRSFARFLFETATAVFPSFSSAIFARLSANVDHFNVECAAISYAVAHEEALQLARSAGVSVRTTLANNASTPQERAQAISTADALLQRAYLVDAFGLHFGSDLFASGHTRTPRKELLTVCTETAGGLLANYMHDEDGRNGLSVVNARGDRWTALGDANFFDPRNLRNVEIATSAAHASREEVETAFLGLAMPATGAFLSYVPRVDPNSTQVSCPLFQASPAGGLQKRGVELRPMGWAGSPVPPVDASVLVCPASTVPLPPCTYTPLTAADCPGGVELTFSKQGFADPALFGARTLCFDANQQAYVMRYGNASLSTGAIVGIAVGCFVFAALLLALCVYCCCLRQGGCCVGSSFKSDREAIAAHDVEMGDKKAVAM